MPSLSLSTLSLLPFSPLSSPLAGINFLTHNNACPVLVQTHNNDCPVIVQTHNNDCPVIVQTHNNAILTHNNCPLLVQCQTASILADAKRKYVPFSV